MSLTITLADPDAHLQYGDVRFGASVAAVGNLDAYQLSHADFLVKALNIYNASNTEVEAVRYIIQCRAYLSSDNLGATNQTLERIRIALMTPKQTLQCFGMGVYSTGKFGEVPEINFGPKPMSFHTQPIGSLGAMINWTVQFEVSTCEKTRTSLAVNTFRTFSYSSQYENDAEGLTVRTVSGGFSVYHSEAVITDKSNNQSTTTPGANLTYADSMRSNVNIPIPFGFQRIRDVWTTSPDHVSCNFTIIDRQLPGTAYHPGIVKASGNYTFQNESAVGEEGATVPNFAKTIHTLSATLTTAPGINPGIAGLHFFNMLRHRVKLIQDELKSNAADDDAKGNIFAIVPTGLKVSNGLFDNARTTSFVSTFKVAAANKNYLFAAMWQPIPNTDYQEWQSSLNTENVNNPYGTSGMTENPDFGSVTLNLCDQKREATVREESILPGFDAQPISTLWECPELDSEYSWVEYDVKLQVFQVINQERHKAAMNITDAFTELSTAAFGTKAIGAELEFASANQKNSSNVKKKYPASPVGGDVTEVGTQADVYIKLSFKGARFGKKPSVPAISSYGGVTAQLLKEGSSVANEVSWGGCIINGVSAVKWYRLDGTPDDLDHYLRNPLIPGTQGENKNTDI